MSNLTPQVQVAMLCSHSDEDSCVLTEAGHTVSAIRLVVSAATPSKWRDGIVTRVSGDSGWLRVDLLEPSADGEAGTVWVWNHSDLSTLLRTGEPVALHALYGILAVGAERFSVLVD
ncbi:MAG: hypothetical protein JWM49_934 [Microbacteriaceae bacterium]|nr:hypothetical protein [Microbacteriaceae bacterium]